MGVNVAFDIVDNTDDIEPVYAQNRDMMLKESDDSRLARQKMNEKKQKQREEREKQTMEK